MHPDSVSQASLDSSKRQPTATDDARRRTLQAGEQTVDAPPPNTLRYNDWRRLPVAPVASFSPTQPVSVIVAYFEQLRALQALLGGLERQTYPRGLFEVIVVDDGSRQPLEQPASPLDVRVIHQQRRGFGLARARNSGTDAAAHGILVFLDGDVVPAPGLLAAHARWHHAVADALVLGFRSRAAPGSLTGRAGKRRESAGDARREREFDLWREPLLNRSDDLTTSHDWLFQAMVGANFSIRKRFYEHIGRSDESFTRYGGEDTELAYRACNRGGVLVPDREARVRHPAASVEELSHKRRLSRAQGRKLRNLIPHPIYRSRWTGRIYAVPRHVVTVKAVAGSEDTVPGSEDKLADAIDSLLEEGPGDLVVRIEPKGLSRIGLHALKERFDADRRVQVAPDRPPLEEYPAAPLHIAVTGLAALDGRVVRRLVRKLGAAVRVNLPLPDGGRATVGRAWALHRAARTGHPIATFGPVRDLAMPGPLERAATSISRSVRKPGCLVAVKRVSGEARHVRNLRTARAFLSWAMRGSFNYLRSSVRRLRIRARRIRKR